MYIGSPIGNIRKEVKKKDIINYLRLDNGKKKKFLVVADSLEKVIKAIREENVIKDFFLMVDEVDTMQSDSSYRPSLERVIDHYFRFNENQRAVVTATLRDFSNDRFKTETCITTTWQNPPVRDIDLIHTNFVDDIAIKIIQKHLEKNPDEKIMVAYNSLDGILNIIRQLPKELQAECGVLCSENNYDKVKEYVEDVLDAEGYLHKQIVLMTCSYFAGIDIHDKCHLISISTHNQPFTLLSPNRLAQIAGRCRNGLISETIIYDTKPLETEETYHDYKVALLRKADKYCQVVRNLADLAEEDKDLTVMRDFAYSFTEFNAKGRVANDYTIRIIRKNVDNEYVPAYFNIDNLLGRWELHHDFYADQWNLRAELLKKHKVNFRTWYLKRETHNTEVIKEVKEENKERLARHLEEARDFILEWYDLKGDISEIVNRGKKSPKNVALFYERFVDLYWYVDINFLLNGLIENYEMRKFRNFNNALIFWCLDNTHSFKAHVLALFDYASLATQKKKKPGIIVTTKEKREKMATLFEKQLKMKISEDVATEYFSAFFKVKRTGGNDKIVGLNPRDFPEPKLTIKDDANLLKLFVFPN